MLLEKIDTPDKKDWLTELKFDGIRLILSKHNNKTRLYTRHNTEVTNRFSELCKNDLPDGTILDGELVVLNANGKPDLELMMKRFMSYRDTSLKVEYVVFDIIEYAALRVTSKRLIERKELLNKVLPEHPHITELSWIEGNAKEYFNAVKEQSLEGIVMKDPNSTYTVNKRSSSWLKVINYKFADGLITGFRKKDFGLLIESNEGVRWGIMEFMPLNAKREFYNKIDNHDKWETNNFIHLNEHLPCKIRYRHFTSNGYMHIPTFISWL